MNTRMTCGRAEEILRGQDGMPDDFIVDRVAEAGGSWICSFVEHTGGRASGKNFRGFAQIWINDSEDGRGTSPAAQRLGDGDIAAFGGETFRILDKR